MSAEHDAGQHGDVETSFEELYEHAPCALLSTLPDGTIVRANATFLEWLQQTPEQVLGKVRFQALLTMGTRIYYETHYAPLLQMQGFVNEVALEVRRGDGSVCPVVASARQVRDASGSPRLARVALFDSTDRRGYERELLVARRQAEQAAQDLAVADRRRNEFVTMLAHELRNPLAPIRSAVEILRRAEHASDIVGKTTLMMQRQVDQMVRLVEDLLDVSRIGQDKFTVRRMPVDLSSVVHHAVETSEPLLRSAGLTFSVTLPDVPIYIEADAARLTQVVGNVLSNAVKFTPTGGTVSLILTPEGNQALIRIRDSGIGIEAEKLSRVFDLFMQAGSTAERRDGLGIGLTLARSLVERHGGVMTVHSEGLGHGTEFVIHLPVLAEAPESVVRTIQPPAAEARQEFRRILVVDDNPDSTAMLAMLFEMFGHQVEVAHDGLEAVERTAVFRPHLVLLDIGLPRLNGYEAAKRIRAQAGHQPVLVAVTGWGQEDDRRRSLEAGFDAHLVKPVDHDVLTKLIAELPRDSSV